MISVNLNSKRIRVETPEAMRNFTDERDVYIHITTAWQRSPWLRGDVPVSFSWGERSCDNELVVAPGWTLEVA